MSQKVNRVPKEKGVWLPGVGGEGRGRKGRAQRTFKTEKLLCMDTIMVDVISTFVQTHKRVQHLES